jgi:PAS domain S-box-containing protein
MMLGLSSYLARLRLWSIGFAVLGGATLIGIAELSNLADGISELELALLSAALAMLLLAVALVSGWRAERRAQAAEMRLRDAIESIGAGFALFDSEDRLVISNEMHKRMYEKNRPLMVPGTRFADILRGSAERGHHPEAVGRIDQWVAERMEKHLNPGEPFEQDRGDGKWLLIGERRTSEGGIVGTWTDISQLKRQEKLLRSSEEMLFSAHYMLQTLIDICPLAVIEVGPDLIVRSWNPAAETIFGWMAWEAIGKPLQIAPPEQLERARAEILPRLEQEPVIEIEAERRRKDGRTISVSVWVTARRDSAGKAESYVAFVADISQRKRMEEELRRSHRMQAVGQLTGGIAHEFNNLLLIILGNMEFITSAMAGHPGVVHQADRVLRAAQRGATLTQQLLAYARRQTLKPEPISVNQMLEELQALARASVGDSVTLHIAAEPDIGRINADRAQLETALLNLILNGRDALPPSGGAIVIRARNTTLDDATAVALDLAPGKYVAIEVDDNGRGMTSEVLARAVEPFFTTKDVGQGSGLGLSMVHGFVKQSGGHLQIESQVEMGTLVRVLLPATAIAVQLPAAGSHLAPRSGLRVLIVEDEPAVLEISIARIQSLGYQTLSANDGPGALRVMDSVGPPDILFTDVTMPGGMNGVELARSMLAKYPEVRVVFTTGHNEQISVLDTAGTGMTVLRKPYLKAELARVLRECLAAPAGGTTGQVVPFPVPSARPQSARNGK